MSSLSDCGAALNKYEQVYLQAYWSVNEAKQQITDYFNFYNTRRPYYSLGGHTPDMTYFAKQSIELAA